MKAFLFPSYLLLLYGLFFQSCSSSFEYDVIIRNAVIFDGTGNTPVKGDIGINKDTIAFIGDLKMNKGKKEFDAKGLAISPGFVNMLSWATVSLLADGRAMSDIKQGVTLEVMGEGNSMGPLNEAMRKEELDGQGDIKYEVYWRTLGEYLTGLEKKGVSPNIASFVGATSLRIHELGYENRKPTNGELKNMQLLVKQAMNEGAMGLSSALIYAPAFYADEEEILALCQAMAPYNGLYITHMKSEGNRLEESVQSVIKLAEKAKVKAEIYHLKAAGIDNWSKMDKVITSINKARNQGIDIAANMYNYIAGATGLDAAMPPWVQEGGYGEWAKRLKDLNIRKKVIAQMKINANDWENLYASAGSPDKLLLVDFRQDSLKKYTGKTLAEVATLRGKSPEETAIDLVIQDSSRVGTVYFLMNEENVKKQIKLPWVSFGSDAGAPASEGVFLKSSTHPRAYGNFARLLGKYVRDEKVIKLEEAVRKLAALPCERLGIAQRGYLKKGYFADLVLFDPKEIADLADFQNPHQYAVGVKNVWVNGKLVLLNGEPTEERPGRFIKGPGYQKGF
ncbi:MAG: N-acyl-D-amino-acid deacylase family protein [Bacteroidota bacterium]|jgi:N-acyl-D-amino-acid deacylase